MWHKGFPCVFFGRQKANCHFERNTSTILTDISLVGQFKSASYFVSYVPIGSKSCRHIDCVLHTFGHYHLCKVTVYLWTINGIGEGGNRHRGWDEIFEILILRKHCKKKKLKIGQQLSKLSKIVKIVENCQKLSKLSKLS